MKKFKETLEKMMKEDYYDPMARFDLMLDDGEIEYMLEVNTHRGILYASKHLYQNGTFGYTDTVKFDLNGFDNQEEELVLDYFKSVLDMRHNILNHKAGKMVNLLDNPQEEAERSAKISVDFVHDVAFALNSGKIAEYARVHQNKLNEMIYERDASYEKNN